MAKALLHTLECGRYAGLDCWPANPNGREGMMQ
jgi:hypothetical protein